MLCKICGGLQQMTNGVCPTHKAGMLMYAALMALVELKQSGELSNSGNHDEAWKFDSAWVMVKRAISVAEGRDRA